MDTAKKRCLDVEPDPVTKRARFEPLNPDYPVNDEIAWSQPDNSRDESGTVTPQSFILSRPSIAATSVTSHQTSKRPKRYVCQYEECGKAFDRPIRLEVHVRSHTNDRCIKCPEPGCEKAFFKSEHLKQHQKDKHSDERSYVCTYVSITDGVEHECGKGFTTGTKYRRHLAMHEEKEATRCTEPGCGREFRKQDTLQRHIMRDHLKQDSYRCTLPIQLDGDLEHEECGQLFPTPTQLKTHQNRIHLKNRHVCHLCSPHAPSAGDLTLSMNVVAFATHSELLAHSKVVHPPTCSDCSAVFESNKSLRAHMDIQHTSVDERKKFACAFEGCGKSFTKNGNLKVHISTVHNKTRNFICGEYDVKDSKKIPADWDGIGCGQGLSTKAALEDHIRTKHMHLPQSIRPSRLKKMIKQEENNEQPDLAQREDDSSYTNAISLLTGAGYEEARPIACLKTGCQNRFRTDYALGQHLELTHGWNVDDAGEAIAERKAMESEQFWIGRQDGMGDEDVSAHDDVAQRLHVALMDASNAVCSNADNMLVDPALD